MSIGQITIPLSNYKSNGDRIAPGTYNVIVDDLEMGETSGQGGKPKKPMLSVWFRVLDGEYADSVVKDRFLFQDNMLWRLAAFLQGLGIKTPKKDFRISADRLLNKKLVITVDDGKPFRGRVSTEVQGYARLEKTVEQAEHAADDSALDDLDVVDEETEETTPAPKSKTSTSEPVDDNDDDLDDLDDLEDIEVD